MIELQSLKNIYGQVTYIMNRLNTKDIHEITDDLEIEYPITFDYSSKTLDFFKIFESFILKSIYEDNIDFTFESSKEMHYFAFRNLDDAKLYITKINIILDILENPDNQVTFNVTDEMIEKYKEFFTIHDEEE